MSPVGVQNRDLVHKVPLGTLQNRTDSLCFFYCSLLRFLSYKCLLV